MNNEEQEIYDYAKGLFEKHETKFTPNTDWKYEHTERCIEVPWFACKLNEFNIHSLLDIGFTFASHDYLRLILDYSKKSSLEGMDIIEPEQVLSRYPTEWKSDINEIPVHILDISKKYLSNKYDAVSLVSTIEHVGYDKAAVTVEDSAFERAKNKEDVVFTRDPLIEEKVLNHAAEMLKENGYLIVTVPTGKGEGVLIQDSKKLWTAYWEYETSSLKKLTEHSKFQCIEQRFFKLENGNWVEKETAEALADQTANMLNHVVGVTCMVMQKK